MKVDEGEGRVCKKRVAYVGLTGVVPERHQTTAEIETNMQPASKECNQGGNANAPTEHRTYRPKRSKTAKQLQVLFEDCGHAPVSPRRGISAQNHRLAGVPLCGAVRLTRRLGITRAAFWPAHSVQCGFSSFTQRITLWRRLYSLF
jgi:hypothetical protein